MKTKQRQKRGQTLVEGVMLLVLIAVAGLVGFHSMGRGASRGTFTVTDYMIGDKEEANNNLEMRRGDTENDAEVSKNHANYVFGSNP